MRTFLLLLVSVSCLQASQEVLSSATQELNDEQWPDNVFLRGHVGEWICKPSKGGVSDLFNQSFESQKELDAKVEPHCLQWVEECKDKEREGRFFLKQPIGPYAIKGLTQAGFIDNGDFSQLEEYLICLSARRVLDKLELKE